MQGFTTDGERLWSFIEWTPDNLRMMMQWRKETSTTLSAKCEGLSAIYIRKLVTGEKQNPARHVLKQLSQRLEVFFFFA